MGVVPGRLPFSIRQALDTEPCANNSLVYFYKTMVPDKLIESKPPPPRCFVVGRPVLLVCSMCQMVVVYAVLHSCAMTAVPQSKRTAFDPSSTPCRTLHTNITLYRHTPQAPGKAYSKSTTSLQPNNDHHQGALTWGWGGGNHEQHLSGQSIPEYEPYFGKEIDDPPNFLCHLMTETHSRGHENWKVW